MRDTLAAAIGLPRTCIEGACVSPCGPVVSLRLLQSVCQSKGLSVKMHRITSSSGRGNRRGGWREARSRAWMRAATGASASNKDPSVLLHGRQSVLVFLLAN